MDLTAINNSNAAGGAAKTARTGLGEDLNTFLMMLTTQLKNQDPTNPMDTHQMTAQLVDFANVEQQIAQNQNLEDLVRLQSNNADFGALNYIGRSVQIEGNETHVGATGTTWGYQIDRLATSVDLHVMNAKGQRVYSETGNLANSVRHEFSWNTIDGQGKALEPGNYSLMVIAKDAAGKAIDSTVDSTGLVSGIKSNTAGPSLLLGKDIEVALSEIVKIK